MLEPSIFEYHLRPNLNQKKHLNTKLVYQLLCDDLSSDSSLKWLSPEQLTRVNTFSSSELMELAGFITLNPFFEVEVDNEALENVLQDFENNTGSGNSNPNHQLCLSRVYIEDLLTKCAGNYTQIYAESCTGTSMRLMRLFDRLPHSELSNLITRLSICDFLSVSISSIELDNSIEQAITVFDQDKVIKKAILLGAAELFISHFFGNNSLNDNRAMTALRKANNTAVIVKRLTRKQRDSVRAEMEAYRKEDRFDEKNRKFNFLTKIAQEYSISLKSIWRIWLNIESNNSWNY